MPRQTLWGVIIGANVLFCCVLSFYQTSDAAPKRNGPPFANSVEQRFELMELQRETNELIKEQNQLLKEQLALLKSGGLKVSLDGK